MKTFLTSDTHYFHKNVLIYSKRPYSSLEEMHESLINNWNEAVSAKDLVYHLGDFFISNKIEEIESILSRLNGTIRLIQGNHDKGWLKKINRIPSAKKIEWVKPYHEIKVTEFDDIRKVCLMHYPLRSWNQSHHGSCSFHGHCHSSLDNENLSFRRLDIGVDGVAGFRPIELKTAISIVRERPMNNHHGD